MSRFGEVLVRVGCSVLLLVFDMECSTGIMRVCDGVDELMVIEQGWL